MNRNDLQDKIDILPVEKTGHLFPAAIFDFTMCNPPFYKSWQELLQATEAKELGANAICTGAENEMITPGGEVAFVRRMVEESLQTKTKCM